MERADCTDRARLRGLGEEILILVVQHASPAQLTDWLKLPLELSEGDADFLLKPNECCQVRRKGEQVLTVVMERASPKQWSKWLQIPLEHALRARKSNLVDQLIAAGPRLSGPAVDAINIYRASAGVCAGGGSGGGGGGGNGGRRGARKMAGCCPRVRLVPARPSSSCCKPPEDAPAAIAATAAVAVAVIASDASGPSCCPSSSGSPEFAISPVACRERRRRSGLPAAERRETSNATPSCSPAVAVAGCAPVSCGDANLDIPIPVIDVDGAAALVNSDKLCLHRATMARDLVRMRQIIGGGVDRNATDLWSCTALHRAAEQDDAEPVRLLLAAGLDVRARDMEGYSPLHFASARGAATAIVDLLAAGSCLSATGLNGDTPLHSAVRFLSLPTVRILLASDADESAKNCEGHTPADVTGVLPDGREIENQPDPLMAQSILALLAAAPAQRRLRTWKRRAWLVMLRARAQAEALKAVVDLDLGVRVGDDVGPAPAADHAVAADNEKVEDALPCVPSKCCGGGGDVDAGDVGGGDVSAGVVGAGAVSGAAVSGDAASADAVSGGDVRAGGGCGGGAGAGVLEEEGDATDSELLDLVDQTTGLAEEGVFQKIVRFL